MKDITIIRPWFPIPSVKVGSKWKTEARIWCRNGKIIPEGDIAEVLSFTHNIPHNEIMERGHNLIVSLSGLVTVWATFEQCISRGIFTRLT